MADSKTALKTLGGLVSIPVVFGLLGLIAQLSQYQFLGLSAEPSKTGLMDLLKSYETEGFLFVFHTITDEGFAYIGENLYAITALLGVGIIFGSFYLLRQRNVTAVTEPWYLLPLLFVGSIFVLMRYDVPSRFFTSVLRSQSTTIDAFDVTPAFQSRAQETWTDIVCERIGSNPEAASICGAYSKARYKQRADGKYFFNVLLTTSMAVLFLLLYLLRPPDSSAPLLRNFLFVITGLGVALNVLALPYVYSRTVRATTFPIGHSKKASSALPAFTICNTANTECFGYRLEFADFDLSASDIVIDNPDGDDVLRAHLLEAIGAPIIIPPRKQPLRP